MTVSLHPSCSPSAPRENDTSGANPQPLLDVENLVTRFPTPRGVVHAVDGVSFTLRAGDTLGIVGESGSGKSVLARSITRLNPGHGLTSGRISFTGRDLTGMSKAELRSIWGKEIAMVFQNPMTSLNPVVRIGRQITESLQVHLDLGRRAARVRAIELLQQVGIPEPARRFDNYPHELSGGMRQRVCIAIAIACAPRLLFADEPTTALDVTIQRQILDLMTSLRDHEGMSMVLITHDLGVVARRADRIMVMYGGRAVEYGTTKTLFREMRHPYTAALLASIPRITDPSHSRHHVIPGRPVDIVAPPPGCRFAPRCQYAQARCLVEDPVHEPGVDPTHTFACFFPLGTPAGDAAREANLRAGRTAAGLPTSETAA